MKQYMKIETISKSDTAKFFGSLQAVAYKVRSGKLREVGVRGFRFKRILIVDLVKQLRMELAEIQARDRQIKDAVQDLQDMIEGDKPENYGYLNYAENAELIQNRI